MPTARLTVTTWVDRAHYYAGEAVVVSARVCNDSEHEHTYRTHERDPWWLYVFDRDEEGVATSRTALREDEGGPFLETFAAGECRETTWTWDRVRTAYPEGQPAEPASYQAVAQYNVSTVQPEGRTVTGRGESAWFALHDGDRPDQEPPPPGDPGPDDRVTVTVTSDKDVYVEGEHVRFTIRVCNNTDESQQHHADRADPVGWAVAYHSTPDSEWSDTTGRTDMYAHGGNHHQDSQQTETVTMTFAPGECRTFDYEWDQIVQYAMDDDPRGAEPGQRAPAGDYVIDVYWDIHSWSSASDEETVPILRGETTFELR